MFTSSMNVPFSLFIALIYVPIRAHLFFLFGELVVSRKDTITIIKTMDRNV